MARVAATSSWSTLSSIANPPAAESRRLHGACQRILRTVKLTISQMRVMFIALTYVRRNRSGGDGDTRRRTLCEQRGPAPGRVHLAPARGESPFGCML